MTALIDRLSEVMAAKSWEHADLVRVSGESSSVVSQWLGKGSKVIKTIGKIEAAMRIEEASGYAALWIAKGVGPKFKKSVAHDMSHQAGSIETVRSMLWEELVLLKTKEELPPVFQVPAADNSMAPRLRQEVKATFERDLTPQLGDGVLVRDSAGDLHIRIYRRGRPGTWEAHALNEDFAPLLSDRDGLEVWAVLTAVDGRWS